MKEVFMDNGAVFYRRFLESDNTAVKKDAISEIIKIYKDGLILYINSIVDNYADAEDIAINVFAKLYCFAPKFAEKSSFKTWIYAMGKNEALNTINKKARHQEIPLDNQPPIYDNGEVEHEYIKKEDKLRLYKAMKKLKDEYRQVLELVYIEGLSNSEAAEVMEKTERQIRNLLYRGKKALQKELKKEGFDYEEL